MFQQFCTVCVLYCVFGVCVCECVFKKDKDREVRNKGLKKRRLRHTSPEIVHLLCGDWRGQTGAKWQ